MKLLSLSIILLFSFTYSILLNNKKICKDCKYYIGDVKKCKYLYEIDLVTGKKTHKYAEIMRKYDDECGVDAKYFEINKIKFITVPYYFLKDNLALITISMGTILYAFAEISTIMQKK